MFASSEAYDQYVGRYGAALSHAHVTAAGVQPGHTALDVGCGPGALTQRLAEAIGGEHVAAVDPSAPFVEACRARVPGADVRIGTAERLPDFGRLFDFVMSQLVVNFMTDAESGMSAMRAATRPGGLVTACVWDYADGMTMLRNFWDAALELDPNAPDEGRFMRHCSPAELRALWEKCGLDDVETDALDVEASYTDFDEFWGPFLSGVGPGGDYCASLDAERRDALRDSVFRRLGEPTGPFTLPARAWFVRGRV